jgi:hypothetical protein
MWFSVLLVSESLELYITNHRDWYRPWWAILPLTSATDVPGSYSNMKTDTLGQGSGWTNKQQRSHFPDPHAWYIPRNRYQLHPSLLCLTAFRHRYCNECRSMQATPSPKIRNKDILVLLSHQLLAQLSQRYRISSKYSSHVGKTTSHWISTEK